MVTPERSAPNLGVLLFLPYRHMEQRILETVATAGYAITLPQARLFQRVDREGSRLTRLAEAAQVSKQAAKFLVDQLESAGYVERVPDPSDGRARLIRATRRGREVIALASTAEREIEQEWRDHLGGPDIAELERILVRLREITDPYA